MIGRRGKQKVILPTHKGVTDAYRTYCFMTFKEMKGKKVKVNHDSKFNISRKLHSDIIDSCNLKIKELILNGYEFEMPHNIGTLAIYKVPNPPRLDANGKLDTQKLRPDWNATLKLWEENPKAKELKKKVFHMNPHTRGYSCRLRIRKRLSKFKFYGLYSVKACRSFNVEMAKRLKQEDSTLDYLEWFKIKNIKYVREKIREREESKLLKNN